MRRIRTLAAALVAAAVITVVGAPLAAGPAGATGTIKPVLSCVFPADAAGTSYIAVWGWSNTTDAAATIPIGDTNRFDPLPQGRGQPTSFPVGSVTNAFTVTWDGTNLTWRLNGNYDTASRNSPKCASNPVPQGTDSPQAFAILAAVAGVVALVGVCSAWMVRRRRQPV
jgi:hypothetical protein